MKLGYYKVNGHKVRLANGKLTIPVDDRRRRLRCRRSQPVRGDERPGQAGPVTAGGYPGQEPPPPAAFRNPQPCSAYWGQKIDTGRGVAVRALTPPAAL